MIPVPTNVLKAALIFCSKGDVRYYLDGVYVDTRNPMQIDVVATDGHRMFSHRSPLKKETPEALRREWILHRESLTAALKTALNHINLDGAHDGFATARADTKNCMARRHFIELIDGRYPDWRTAVAKAVQAEPSHSGFNPQYLGDCMKVAKALKCGGYPVVVSKGEEAASIVSFNDEHSIVVVMPMRRGVLFVPNWAKELAIPDDKKKAANDPAAEAAA